MEQRVVATGLDRFKVKVTLYDPTRPYVSCSIEDIKDHEGLENAYRVDPDSYRIYMESGGARFWIGDEDFLGMYGRMGKEWLEDKRARTKKAVDTARSRSRQAKAARDKKRKDMIVID